MINLVDVMLVLLIIFMVTAPMMQGGVQVRLPRSAAAPLDSRKALNVTVEAGGQVSINERRLSFDQFKAFLGTAAQQSGSRAVYLRGDRAVSYGQMMRVMDAIRAAGLTDVGLVTEPGTP